MREEVLDFRSQAFHAGFHAQFLASVNFFKSDPRKAFFFFFFIAALPLVSSAESRRRVGLRPTKLLVARKKKNSGTQGNCMIVGVGSRSGRINHSQCKFSSFVIGIVLLLLRPTPTT